MPPVTNFRNGSQDGAVSPPPSEPFRLSGKTQNYKVQIETNVDGGNIKSSSITLQKEVTTRSGKEYQSYAESFDGGKTWNEPGSKPPKKISTASGLTADEIKSLQPGGELNKKSVESAQLTAQKNGASTLQKNQIKAGNDATEESGTQTITAEQISSTLESREKTRNQFSGAGTAPPLKYPITLKNEHQDVIKFKMVKYQPKSFSNQTFGFNPREKNREIIGTVVLPIPNGISDTNAVTWGGETMNGFDAAVANVALTTIGEGFSSGVDQIKTELEKLQQNSGEVGIAAKAAFSQAATNVTGILARTQGAVLNPNLELLFQAPTLRPFNFTFKLASRSQDESKTIRSIIRFFKQGMSAQRSQSNLFLKAPHTFQIEYLHRGGEHKFLNKFKECALQSFNVSYTPEGQYATFTDGAMVSYQITMQFQELEPIFNDDYTSLDQNNDTEIGF